MPDNKTPNPKNLTPEQKKQMEQLKKTAGKYKGKSEAELMRELQASMRQGKANGTLSDKQIDAFSQKISPMLNQAQKAKLNAILKKLK